MPLQPAAARERVRSGDARNMAQKLLGCCVIIAVLWAPAGALGGQQTGDSACVRISGSEPGVFITLSRGYRLTGVLPVSFCELERGAAYRLILDGAGFERRIGSFSIVGGTPRVSGVYASMAGKNIVLPGWGSASAGRLPAGLIDDMGIAASLGWLVYEELEYRDMRDELEQLGEIYDGAQTWEDKARLQASLHEVSREVNIQNDKCTRLAIIAGALYAWQVIEPLFLDRPPKSIREPASGELALRGAHESRGEAFIYSLLRPGRGQFYQGKTGRGIFFSATTLAVGFLALEYQTCYEYAVSDYEICVERFNASDDLSEQQRLKSDAGRYWNHLEHEKGRRDASLIVLAGLWGWNVIDTFFPAEHRASNGKYSFEVDARGAGVAVRF
jgi:hypothetical protein